MPEKEEVPDKKIEYTQYVRNGNDRGGGGVGEKKQARNLIKK